MDPFWLAPLCWLSRPLGLQLFVSALPPKIPTMGEVLDALQRRRQKGISSNPSCCWEMAPLGRGGYWPNWDKLKKELGVPREPEEKPKSTS